VGDGDVSDFMDALEKSGCAQPLTALSFVRCAIAVGDTRALADFLCWEGFPALKTLRLVKDPSLADAGMSTLAEALLETNHTNLSELNLDDVRMGVKGMAGLAALVFQGRFERLKKLDLSGNEDVTNQDIIA
jgi:Ran GTPase-activating protein (RanGAP) involved in mRNA processing and transport